MLKKIIELLEKEECLTIDRIQKEVDMEYSAIEDMLNILLNKNKIVEFSLSPDNSSKFACKHCMYKKDCNTENIGSKNKTIRLFKLNKV